MADAPLRLLLRHLHRGRAAPDTAGDAELLDRFVRSRDEAAFELLVWRHGTLVYNVCRRVLRDAHAAEDAFQATFLVLARKAASVGRGEALAGWLYRVAYRAALRARSRAGPPTAADLPEPAAAPSDEALWRDLRPVLDEEIARLPEKYRLPVVLCYLSGLTTDEAARRLGIPRGTVLSRLAWARERLRGRLSLRGVTLSAGLSVAVLAAAAPASVVKSAARAALSFVGGQPTAATAGAVRLMEGVLRDMVMNRVKNGLLVVLGLVVIGVGVGLWAARTATAEPTERKHEEAARQAAPAEPPGGKEEARVPEAPRPIGVWERTVVGKEGGSITLTIRVDAQRVTLTQSMTDKGKTIKATIEGDYSVSRDYVLYGFVTGIDVSEGIEPEEAAKGQAAILDQPFCVRYRLDANALTLRDIKLGGVKDNDQDGLQMLAGRYKKKVAAAKDEAP
jgi:RNA polymerase sigma factor (sigma-70 family)